MNRKPARTVAPGRIVERELEARSWSIETLAAYSGLPVEKIRSVIHDSNPITDQVARGFAEAFGTSIEFWKNLESSYHARKPEKRSLA
jgi:plasmid maintenance system antidote protein VapI